MKREFEQIQMMIDSIGFESTIKVCQMFAGEQVYFPKTVITYLNYEGIKKEFSEGKSYRELSIKYGLTTRQIREITAPKNKDSGLRQLLLF